VLFLLLLSFLTIVVNAVFKSVKVVFTTAEVVGPITGFLILTKWRSGFSRAFARLRPPGGTATSAG
jgi:hypothetical protein